MNKELKVIDFYCKKCKKSMKVSYMVTGNRNYPVLPRVMMKCHHCGRVMTLKNFKEGELLDRVEQRLPKRIAAEGCVRWPAICRLW